MTSIEEVRQDVQRAFAAVMETADSSEPQPLAKVEASLWTGILALGRALLRLYLARQVAFLRPTQYEYEGVAYELVAQAESDLGSRFGKVVFTRPVGRRVGAPREARDFPVDRALGLCSGFSLMVVTTLVQLCAQMAFASARRTFSHVFEWAPSSRATLRMVDALGAEAEPFVEQALPPDNDGEVLIITVDGKGAPAISSREHKRRTRPHRERTSKNGRHQRRQRRRENPQPRRKPGDKSKNAKMAAVGVLYTLEKTTDGKLEGPINKRTYATFESYRALFERILKEAKKRGYGTEKFSKVVFIADGARVLWDLQKEFFPDAEVCLDWYHAVEKLWKAGKALYRGRTNQPTDWVHQQKTRLRNGDVAAVQQELHSLLDGTPRTGPGNKYRREVLENVITYFDNHASRMQYQRLREQDIDIGSGIVEGAVRHVVGVRLDGPGMRWSRDRAESVLQLRCILINDQWDDFTNFLAGRQQIRLPARPVPTRTHDAKPMKAA